MGLDISYYGRARLLTPTPEDEAAFLLRARDEYGPEVAVAMGLAKDEDDVHVPWENPSFPGRAEGVRCGLPYACEEHGHFRAGSYGGYNQWRKWLALFAGVKDLDAFFEAPDMSLPFAELIAFSDCEGTIGPVVSAKLRDDFVRLKARAIAFADECFVGEHHEVVDSNDHRERDHHVRLYEQWETAFTTAARGGWVAFH